MKRAAMAWAIKTLAHADRDAITDHDLLARFTEDGDQAAFAAIVTRHTSLVLGVCRRTLANQQDAEDACQAVFLLLAKKAGHLRWQASIANWLYATARKVARNARVSAMRRTRREAAAAVPETFAPVDPITGHESRTMLDEELEKLPPRLREPLVLCCLEGLTRDEAALRLGVPVSTLRGQLERGRKRLADALASRGCSLGIALLATAVTHSAGASSPKVLESILAAVSGSPSPAAAALVKGVAMNSLLAHAKLAAVMLVGVLAVGVMAVITPAAGQSSPEKPARTVHIVSHAAPVPIVDNKAAEKSVQEAVEMIERVTDAPIARCRFWCQVAVLRNKLGDRAGAIEALQKAQAASEQIKTTPPPERPWDSDVKYHRVVIWREIASGYARLGDSKAVLELAAAVPKELQKDRSNEAIISEAARAAAEAGHSKAAAAIIAKITDEKDRKLLEVHAQRAGIIHRARSGDVPGAIENALKLPTAEDQVIALMYDAWVFMMIPDYQMTFPAQEGVAGVQLAKGDRRGAQETAKIALSLVPKIEKDQRGKAATSIVQIFCRLDDVPSARAALSLLSPESANKNLPMGQQQYRWDLHAKAYLAAAEVRAGNDKAALALAEDFSRPGNQAYIFQHVALAQARAGRAAESKATFARSHALVTSEGSELWNLIGARSLAGDFDGAAETAKKLDPADVTLWESLSYGKAIAGDYQGAREAAAHLGRSAERSAFYSNRQQSLQIIAKLQAQAGKTLAVREWIDKEDDPLMRAYALLGIAEGLYREDVPAQRKP